MIHIKITPNRPDALGVHGVARDLAARGLGRLKAVTVDAVPGAITSQDEPFDRWRRLLLHLLEEAGLLPVDSFNTALLRERENTLLDLYLDLFLTEVEALLRRGLIKRYRQHEGQVKALRGTLLFGQHIARNVVHQERFYTRHQTYDRNHLAHSLLQQALLLIPSVTTTASLIWEYSYH